MKFEKKKIQDFFELLLDYCNYINSDDCIGKISLRSIRSNPNFARSLWRICQILPHFNCFLQIIYRQQTPKALSLATHKISEVLTASFNLLIIGMWKDLSCGRSKMTLMLANEANLQSKLHHREFKPARVSVTSAYTSISVPNTRWYICIQYKCIRISSPFKMPLGVCWQLGILNHLISNIHYYQWYYRITRSANKFNTITTKFNQHR